MSRIVINDLNSADSYLLELTNEELVMISGEGWFSRIFGAILTVVGVVTGQPYLTAAGHVISMWGESGYNNNSGCSYIEGSEVSYSYDYNIGNNSY